MCSLGDMHSYIMQSGILVSFVHTLVFSVNCCLVSSDRMIRMMYDLTCRRIRQVDSSCPVLLAKRLAVCGSQQSWCFRTSILLSEVCFFPLIFSIVYVENFGLYPKLSKMTSHYLRFGLSVFLDVMKTTQSCTLTCIMWAEVCQVLYQPLGFPEPICITCHWCRTSIVRPMKTWHGIFEGILFGHSASRVLRMQHTFVKEEWGLCYDHIAFVWVSLGLLLLLQSQHTQVHTKDEAGDDGPLQSL